MNAVLKPKFTIQREHYSEALCAELLPLLKQNWSASSSYKDAISLSVDFPKYKVLDEKGMVMFVSARQDGRLVGYSLWWIVTSLNWAGRSAHGVAWYVTEECVGYGMHLLRETERLLADEGIRRKYWLAKPDSVLYKLLVADGFVGDEIVMEKVDGLPS
jgi:hypothetical protein